MSKNKQKAPVSRASVIEEVKPLAMESFDKTIDADKTESEDKEVDALKQKALEESDKDGTKNNCEYCLGFDPHQNHDTSLRPCPECSINKSKNSGFDLELEEKILKLEDAIDNASAKTKINNLKIKLDILYEQRDKANSEVDQND